MADDNLTRDIEKGLEDAKASLEYLQTRMMAGEEVDEKELIALARAVATYIEEVRNRIQEAVEAEIGPIPQDRIREAMRERMTPERYEEWLANEEERHAFREEVKRDKVIREQLSEDQETNG